MLENRRLKDEEEEKKWKTCLVKLYLNLSLCNLRMHKPKPAITNCRKVLDLDKRNVKAVYRLGQVSIRSNLVPLQQTSHLLQAYMQLSEFNLSRQHLVRAGRMAPGNSEIRQELEKLNRYAQWNKYYTKHKCISSQKVRESFHIMVFYFGCQSVPLFQSFSKTVWNCFTISVPSIDTSRSRFTLCLVLLYGS